MSAPDPSTLAVSVYPDHAARTQTTRTSPSTTASLGNTNKHDDLSIPTDLESGTSLPTITTVLHSIKPTSPIASLSTTSRKSHPKHLVSMETRSETQSHKNT
jgi:hypothetical protein